MQGGGPLGAVDSPIAILQINCSQKFLVIWKYSQTALSPYSPFLSEVLFMLVGVSSCWLIPDVC